ncbi:hypothetical protein Tco_0897593 [Tanacetum coccineum]
MRGDDVGPQMKPESLVPVGRFQGSRLASGPASSPYQPKGSHGESSHSRPIKFSCVSSGSTIGAAIVEAESSLEKDSLFDKKFPSHKQGGSKSIKLSSNHETGGLRFEERLKKLCFATVQEAYIQEALCSLSLDCSLIPSMTEEIAI